MFVCSGNHGEITRERQTGEERGKGVGGSRGNVERGGWGREGEPRKRIGERRGCGLTIRPGTVLPGILVVHGTHCRLENIGEECDNLCQ